MPTKASQAIRQKVPCCRAIRPFWHASASGVDPRQRAADRRAYTHCQPRDHVSARMGRSPLIRQGERCACVRPANVAALTCAIGNAIRQRGTNLLGSAGPISSQKEGINRSIKDIGSRRVAIQPSARADPAALSKAIFGTGHTDQQHEPDQHVSDAATGQSAEHLQQQKE